MARIALLVLLLANVGYFAWSQGWLRDFGFAPEQQSEPQRIAQQIRPEALRIVAQDPGDARTPPALPALPPVKATTVDPAPAPAATNPPAAASCPQAEPLESCSPGSSR